jgi:putative ABC transport system ATP-binding protein
MEVSHKKHATAAWLEGLAGSNGFFKTSRHIADALHKTDAVTADYIREHKRHFRYHFSQSLMFLFIWAAASATLLGLGGWLVIQGQLSLGQLVAAELVLSVVFVGISQLGTYLTYLYDLCAAEEELSLFYDVEQDPPRPLQRPMTGDSSLVFAGARGESRGTELVLDLEIPAGSRVLATTDNHAAQRIFTNFLKRHEKPEAGYIAVGGQDFDAFQTHQLRQEIIVLDRPNVVESSIREYLAFSAPEEAGEDALDVLETVGLAPVIAQLSGGMDTRVAATGWPLSIAETMQLKLAAAILARPKVLVLSRLFDVLPEHALMGSLDRLQSDADTTVVCFTNRHSDLGFNRFLYLGEQRQSLFTGYEKLCEAAGLPIRPLDPIPGHPSVVQAS